MNRCFPCCLAEAQREGDVAAHMAYVMGIAHAVERGVIETSREMCRDHALALRTFADSLAEARRKLAP